MNLISIKFFIFLLVTFIFFALFKKERWIVLLLSSIFFYCSNGTKLLLYIVFTTFTIWISSYYISNINNKIAEADANQKKKYLIYKKTLLIITLLLNIGYLCLGKLGVYLSETYSMNNLEKNIILPLGISYYTFSTVGYLLDVYWKKMQFESNYFRFLLFAIYFPHIVQGPISRYNQLGMELKKELKISISNIKEGFVLIVYGYFKKLLIADKLIFFINDTFSNYSYSGEVYFLALLLDVIYIYADFSGYASIVQGISKVFDVELEKNFDHPFSSTNISEFWRRWHISLGSWFRSYVYMPISSSPRIIKLNIKLTKKYNKVFAKYVITFIPIFSVWILTGLWHGTGSGYLVWGLYYALLIFNSIVFKNTTNKINNKLGINIKNKCFMMFQKFRTSFLFMIGRLFTKSNQIKESLQYGKIIVTKSNLSNFIDCFVNNLGVYTFFLLCVFAIIEKLDEKYNLIKWLKKRNDFTKYLFVELLILLIFIFKNYEGNISNSTFGYQGF